MKIAIGILISLLVAALAAISAAYTGLYDVSALSPHSRIAGWYLSTASRAAIKRGAVGIAIPDTADKALVMAGINDYEAMCVGCHGAPGKRPGPVGLGLNPPAPVLQESAERMSVAELFWVTKHGIKMTGMPAWGATHDDDAIWPVVTFISKLPSLDESGYRELLAASSGHGHHAGVTTTNEQKDARPPSDNVHVHSDGSSHVHETPPAEEAPEESPEEHEHTTHEH